jgi:hypothetical protein
MAKRSDITRPTLAERRLALKGSFNQLMTKVPTTDAGRSGQRFDRNDGIKSLIAA